MRTKKSVSAGGIVFRQLDGRKQVAIAARDKGKVWCLPKGMVEENETIEEAALREVREETGLEGRIIDQIDKIDYWFYWKPKEIRFHKFVHFFLMEYVSGNIADHDHEFDEIKWTEIEDALRVLSYKSERQIMGKAKQMLEEMGNRKQESI